MRDETRKHIVCTNFTVCGRIGSQLAAQLLHVIEQLPLYEPKYSRKLIEEKPE